MVNQYKQNVTADKERIGGLVGLRRPSHRPVRSPFEWERRVDHAQEAKECSGHFPVLVQVSQVQVDHDRSQLDFVGQELVFEFPARGSAATHREPLSGINNSPNEYQPLFNYSVLMSCLKLPPLSLPTRGGGIRTRTLPEL